MKVEPHATFRFTFRGIASERESLTRLRKFLHGYDWLSSDSDYDPGLLIYHTDEGGVCEVSLRGQGNSSFETLIDMFFANLCDDKDVKLVKLLYNKDTDKLVMNHSDKYGKYQTVNLSSLKENDAVVIMCRP